MYIVGRPLEVMQQFLAVFIGIKTFRISKSPWKTKRKSQTGHLLSVECFLETIPSSLEWKAIPYFLRQTFWSFLNVFTQEAQRPLKVQTAWNSEIRFKQVVKGKTVYRSETKKMYKMKSKLAVCWINLFNNYLKRDYYNVLIMTFWECVLFLCECKLCTNWTKNKVIGLGKRSQLWITRLLF